MIGRMACDEPYLENTNLHAELVSAGRIAGLDRFSIGIAAAQIIGWSLGWQTTPEQKEGTRLHGCLLDRDRLFYR